MLNLHRPSRKLKDFFIMSNIWQYIFVHFLTCVVKFNYYLVINKDFPMWIYFKLMDNSHFALCHHFEIGYTRSTNIDFATWYL